MSNVVVDNSIDFEPLFKPLKENPLSEMVNSITREYKMNRRLSRVSDTAKDIRAMIEGFLEENIGFDKGRITLRQLDKIVTSVAIGLVTHASLLNLNEVPMYLRALLLIDGVLKPFNIEVHGGYQKARLSYISASSLQQYYAFLDEAKILSDKRKLASVNNAVNKYYEWKMLGN